MVTRGLVPPSPWNRDIGWVSVECVMGDVTHTAFGRMLRTAVEAHPLQSHRHDDVVGRGCFVGEPRLCQP